MSTIRDVAALAQVSVATVSRVLNKKENVDERTRKIVLEAIDKLSYVPNELARSLYSKQTRTLGVIIPNLTSFYMGGLLDVIEDATISYNYRLMICNSQDNKDREAKYLQVLQQYNVDGILLVTNTTRLQDYLSLGIPIVAIDRQPGDGLPSVSSDNTMGGRLAAEKLVASGCRKIIHFRGPSHLFTVQDRNRGFKAVLDPMQILNFSYDLNFKNPSDAEIENVLSSNPDCDGVFCDSDLIAIHVIQILKRIGRRIPADVQVVGFDDISLSAFLTPTITTIAQPTDMIGRYAVDTLMELIGGRPIPELHHEFPVRLVARETTKN